MIFLFPIKARASSFSSYFCGNPGPVTVERLVLIDDDFRCSNILVQISPPAFSLGEVVANEHLQSHTDTCKDEGNDNSAEKGAEKLEIVSQ